jgi:hypothetical protein
MLAGRAVFHHRAWLVVLLLTGVVVQLLLGHGVTALDNGLGLTPPMVWEGSVPAC